LSKKRVLWLTNTPALLTEEITGRPVVEGSWITALQEALVTNDEFELHIAFMSAGKLPPEVKKEGVTYHPMPRTGKLSRLLRRLFLITHTRGELEYLKSLITKIDPAMVHVFGTESFFGLISDEINIPVLVQIQGIVASFIPVYFGNLGFKKIALTAGIIDFLSGGVVFRYLGEKQRASRESAILSKARFVMGRTEFDRDYTSAVNPNRVYFHLDDPLRKEFFEEGTCSKNSGDVKLLTVIHAEYYKGLDLLFASAEILKKTGIDFTWNVVGISRDDHLCNVILRAMDIGEVPESVILNGKMFGPELAGLMRRSDIYIHTSFIENPSNAICEAMAIGLPVIAARVGGIPSIIEDDLTGLFYERGNYPDLVAKIRFLIDNPGKAWELGNSARANALKRHDTHRITEELVKIYSKVMGYQPSIDS